MEGRQLWSKKHVEVKALIWDGLPGDLTKGTKGIQAACDADVRPPFTPFFQVSAIQTCSIFWKIQMILSAGRDASEYLDNGWNSRSMTLVPWLLGWGLLPIQSKLCSPWASDRLAFLPQPHPDTAASPCLSRTDVEVKVVKRLFISVGSLFRSDTLLGFLLIWHTHACTQQLNMFGRMHGLKMSSLTNLKNSCMGQNPISIPLSCNFCLWYAVLPSLLVWVNSTFFIYVSNTFLHIGC